MSDPNCIFCKIIHKKIPSRIVHEDEMCIAFHDVNPQAPVHLLLVPRKHIPGIDSMTDADAQLVGHLFYTAKKIVDEKGLDKNGYRMIINNGAGAGQTVFHIHLHVLSGRHFAWPPG